MNDINEKCLDRYKPKEDVIVKEATNYPYLPEMKYSEEKMKNYEGGEFPPHFLRMKIGCKFPQPMFFISSSS